MTIFSELPGTQAVSVSFSVTPLQRRVISSYFSDSDETVRVWNGGQWHICRYAEHPAHTWARNAHMNTHTHVGKRTIRTPSPTICLIERDVSWEDLLKFATVQRWVCSFSQFKSAKRCTWLHKRCAARCHDNTPGKTPSLYCYAASVGCLWNVHSYLWPFERQVTANLGQNAPHSLVVNVLLWHAWRDILI